MRTVEQIRIGIPKHPRDKEAFIRSEVIRLLKLELMAFEIADRLGITKQKVREINCAHYQRHSEIVA